MTSCSHFGPQVASYEDIVHVLQYQARHRCHNCPVGGPNLWLCLDAACLFIGCGDEGKDHSGQHHLETGHRLLMNITSKKIWCEECERDVTSSCPAYVARALSLSRSTRYRQTSTTSSHVSPCDDSDDDGDEDSCQRPRGLTGLMNIGNTCYMNAALQSLSNCVPLTNFFTECPGYVALSKNPSLSKNYMKLMKEIWHKKRLSYVTPSAIFNSIKLVHPMFRGYLQHDSQEFLRCFMDQLHEELKQPVLEMEADDEPADFADTNDNSDSEQSSIAEEQAAAFVHRRLPAVQSKRPLYCDAIEMSDTDYETCDSGLSSENSSENAMELASGTAGSSTTEVSDQTLVMSPSKTSLSSSVELTATSDNERETDNVNSVCISTSLESGITTADACNAIGEGFGDSVHNFRSKTLQFDTGSGELGDITVAPLITSNSVLNPSIPSIDSAISDDGSISLSSSMQFDSNISRDDSSTALQKLDSARTTSTVSSKSKRSTPRLRESSESFEWTGKVRRASEGSTLQPPAKPKRPVQYTSIISAIFDGKILSSVQCLTCLRVSSTNETFQDLSLPIPGREQLQFIRASSATQLGPVDCDGPLLQSSMVQRGPCAESASRLHWVSSLISWPFNAAYHMFSWFWGPVITLQDCLAAFFSADELKGDNMYSCEKCKKLRNGVKYSKVLKLPEILCVHLKRFRHEFTFSSKINSYVSFPLEGLDMRPYLHKDCKDEVTSYDLVAVICHHGTAGGGHYTAYGLNYINLSWYEYDDQSVTEVDAQQVETCEAYVLFYRKKNEPIEVIRANAQQLSKCPENGLMTFYVSRLWISKFNSFAEPGPINNYEFLCRHGDIRPSAVQASSIEDLVFPLPQNLWEYLHGRFGGGPAVNRIAVCQHCQLEAERLLKRQKMEKDEFVKLNAAMQDTTSSRCALYGLSNVWFREWENFVLGKTNDPPGPIDNSRICQVKNGVISLLAKSDHVQLTDSMWAMMHNIYGGGPEVLIRPAAPELSSGRASVRSDDEIDSQTSAAGQFDPPSDK